MPPITEPKRKPKVQSPPKPEQPEERKVLYPEVKIAIYQQERDLGRLTMATAKKLLGWETEDEYCERTGDAPGSTMFGDPLLTDEEGKRVQCWHNLGNRPFDESWSRKIAQDILTGNWEFNLENIVISKWGKVTSGQHRLVGLILACQMWAADQDFYTGIWETQPTIECVIAFGGSEDPKVLRTIDNVKPRTLADVFYTGGVFKADQSASERKELARMLDYAVDFLWKRTVANETSGMAYQTHSASVEFLDRHPRILKCITHIFEENKERAISGLHLSCGRSAGVMYLMAAYNTDGDLYRNKRPPTEKDIDFEYWDKAQQFWSDFARMSKVRDAIAHCERDILRLAVLAKAWTLYAENKKATAEDLKLETIENADGITKLAENPDFLGIDGGYKVEAEEEEEPQEDEIERRKKELDATRPQRVEEMKKKLEEEKQKRKDNIKSLQELAKAHPGKTLLFQGNNGGYTAWGDHAQSLVRVLRLPEIKKENGVYKTTIPEAKIKEAIAELKKAKHKVAIAKEVLAGNNKEKKISVTDVE